MALQSFPGWRGDESRAQVAFSHFAMSVPAPTLLNNFGRASLVTSALRTALAYSLNMSEQSESKAKAAPATDASTRPFRVKLRGSVLALVRLPNRRDVRAAIHQLSLTGGVIHLEKPLDEKLSVEVIFHIDETTIRGKAQMLFPMWATQGWMQPFRFTDLNDANRELLDATLKPYMPEAAKTASAGA